MLGLGSDASPSPSTAASVIDMDLTESATVPDGERDIDNGKEKRKRKVGQGLRRINKMKHIIAKLKFFVNLTHAFMENAKMLREFY